MDVDFIFNPLILADDTSQLYLVRPVTGDLPALSLDQRRRLDAAAILFLEQHTKP